MKHQKSISSTLLAILTFVCLSVLPFSVTAEPTVMSITLNPTDPNPLETIKFTAVIESDTELDEVRIIVAECTEGICYKDDFNVSMSVNGDGAYIGDVTLTHDDTVYIKYHIEMLSDGMWYATEITEYNLTEKPSNGDNGNATNGDGDNTPGFELISVLLAGAIIALVVGRKRFG
ncbi:MAG: hypothetical protein KKC68_07915 [Candidatus Thermoplasmatota archaeon]|nr:hypothetical protein [Candidatus Thermoplasmatota archaeon]MBU1941683.1 hypothetical protein [Candidatus Thermoplasmatota archaeon]